MCLGIFDGRLQNVAVPQHTALFRGSAMYMMVLHCNALVGTMYKLSYIGPHTSNWHRSAGPIQWHWPIHVMTLGHRCTRLIHPDGSLICTPASQSGPKLQVLASLPSHSEIYPEFNVGLLTVRPLKQGHSQPSLLFT